MVHWEHEVWWIFYPLIARNLQKNWFYWLITHQSNFSSWIHSELCRKAQLRLIEVKHDSAVVSTRSTASLWPVEGQFPLRLPSAEVCSVCTVSQQSRQPSTSSRLYPRSDGCPPRCQRLPENAESFYSFPAFSRTSCIPYRSNLCWGRGGGQCPVIVGPAEFNRQRFPPSQWADVIVFFFFCVCGNHQKSWPPRLRFWFLQHLSLKNQTGRCSHTVSSAGHTSGRVEALEADR